jgi:hypothetical protein
MSIAFEIKWDRPALDRLLNSPRGEVGAYLFLLGQKIREKARRQVGIDTGQLKGSIHVRQGRRGMSQFVEVGSPLSHALMHHEGTKPHVILPSRSQVLRFSAGGRIIYTRKVNHPGTRPNRYLTDQLYLIK